MTIDEAIAHARAVADTCEDEASKYDICDSYERQVAYQEGKCAREHEQLAEWLGELKAIKSDGFTDDLLNMGFTKGYNKGIDDFVKFANTMPTVEEDDGTTRPMWLEEMAEKLKENKNEQSNNNR